MILNADMKIEYIGSCRYTTIAEKKGYLEQDPHEWQRALKKALSDLEIQMSLKEINAVSFSGHMSGLVAVDKEGEPLRPCILLADSRSEEECQDLEYKVGKQIEKMTGNAVINAFLLPKLVWFKKYEKDLYQKTWRWMLPKDYLRATLTGRYETEYTDAYNSLCLDPVSCQWNNSIIENSGLDKEKFPPVLKPWDLAGNVTEKAAAEYGFVRGTPVFFGGADMACQALGNDLFSDGDSTLTLGTSATFLVQISEIDCKYTGKITYHKHILPEKLYALGSHFNGGLAVNWFAATHGDTQGIDYQFVQKLAEAALTVPAGSNGVRTIPFLAGSGSPYFKSTDCQTVTGISAATTQADLFKSELEGITYNLKETLECFQKLSKNQICEILLAGGGCKVTGWPQMTADIFGMPIHLSQNEDASTIGAAIIGAYGAGIIKDMEQAAKQLLQIKTSIFPNREKTKLYEGYFDEYRELYRKMS